MRKKILYICLLILVVIGHLTCKKDDLHGITPEYTVPTLLRFDTSINSNSVGYYMGIPARYNLNLNNRYPLIICFPGAGAYGNSPADLNTVLVYGVAKQVNIKKLLPTFQVSNESFSFIVFAPQFKEQPTNDQIHQMIDFIKDKYRIDSTRIYLVGTSVGGRMACDYAVAYPQQIAAVVAMSGCSDVDLQEKAISIVENKLPLWLFHNQDDLAWPVSSPQIFTQAINELLPAIKPRLTIFELSEGKDNHDAWSRASNTSYRENGQNIYEWMLNYKRE